ncbi:unnamed protein product [Pylaiella littoralis]
MTSATSSRGGAIPSAAMAVAASSTASEVGARVNESRGGQPVVKGALHTHRAPGPSAGDGVSIRERVAAEQRQKQLVTRGEGRRAMLAKFSPGAGSPSSVGPGSRCIACGSTCPSLLCIRWDVGGRGTERRGRRACAAAAGFRSDTCRDEGVC